MQRALGLLGTFMLVACASPPASAPPVVIPLAPSPPPTAARPPPPPPKPRVATTFFDADGTGSWEPRVRLEPKPEELVTSCYQSALEADPAVAGWVWVELRVSEGMSTSARLRESSPLPEGLTTCVVERLSQVSTGMSLGGPGLLYVSLSSDP